MNENDQLDSKIDINKPCVKRKKNKKKRTRNTSYTNINIPIQSLNSEIKKKILINVDNKKVMPEGSNIINIRHNIFRSLSNELNDNQKKEYHDAVIKKNKFISNYFNGVIHSNVPSNYWYIISWVLGHQKINLPIVNMVVNMLVIICCQIIFPISLIFNAYNEDFYTCNNSETIYNKFFIFVLSLLLTQVTFKSLQSIVYTLIYYAPLIRNKSRCGLFFQMISMFVELIIMVFVWILTWNILITKNDGDSEFQTNLGRLVDILALTFLIEIDDMFIPYHMQKMYENDIDTMREKLQDEKIKDHRLCTLCFVGNLFTFLTLLPIGYSFLVAYCA